MVVIGQGNSFGLVIGPLKLVAENTLGTVCIREKILNNYMNSTSMTKMPKNF